MHVLLVNGGEMTSLVGVFTDQDLMMGAVAHLRRDTTTTEEDGFLMKVQSPHVAGSLCTYFAVYEDGCDPEDWSVLFTVIKTEENKVLDVTI